MWIECKDTKVKASYTLGSITSWATSLLCRTLVQCHYCTMSFGKVTRSP